MAANLDLTRGLELASSQVVGSAVKTAVTSVFLMEILSVVWKEDKMVGYSGILMVEKMDELRAANSVVMKVKS